MKTWIVEVELFMSSDRIEKIKVKANTERKAEIFAKEKAVKLYGWDAPRVISVREVATW